MMTVGLTRDGEEHIFWPQAIRYYKLQNTFNRKLLFGSGVYDTLKKIASFWWHGGTAKKINQVV